MGVKQKISWFDLLNTVIMVLVLIITVYPFYYVLIASFSEGSQVIRGNVVFWPVGFTAKAYEMIPTIKYFFTSCMNTLYYTFFGVTISLVVMGMGAYALSRKKVVGKRVLNFLISFTLWFKAGIIPFYINMDSLHLLNTRMGILLGFCVNAFYIVIMRTYFEGIPIELEESAKLDGLNNFGIFTKIMLPLSKPMLATIALYCAVNRWNGYFWSMVLLKDERKVPLQVLLKKIIVENQVMSAIDSANGFSFTRETLVYAIIVVSVIPIIAVYPFVQKYFVKGLTVGAVKG